MVIFRKISQAKWYPINSGSIQADAVTADLRTTGNKLSLWLFDSSAEENLDKVGLALASRLDKLAPIDLSWVDEDQLSAIGDFQQTPGDTPVHNLRSYHIDAVNIDLNRLGSIARAYFDAFKDGNVKRLTRSEVKKLLESAIKAGDLTTEGLNETLACKIQV